MQTKRNQKTVQERINTYTNNSKTNDFLTCKYQCSVNDRPYEEQNSCYDNGNNCRYNSNTTFAREEGQCIRKSGSFEFVVAGRTNQTCKNTDELIADFSKCCIRLSSGQSSYNTAGQKVGDHQPGYQTCQTCCTIIIICHTYCYADSEQPGHIIDQCSTCFYQEESNDLSCAADVTALHGARTECITNSHQNTTYRKACNWKHQGFSKFL